jgi:hypothetical protein
MSTLRQIAALGGAAAAVLVAACNTTVTSPDVVPASKVTGPAVLPYQYAGAIEDFGIAWLGTGLGTNQILLQAQEGQAEVSDLFADEFRDADFFTNHIQLDTRTATRDNFTLDDTWRILHRARLSNENTSAAYAKYDSLNPNRLTMINLAGFTYILLAESFCGNVPLSTTDLNGTIHYAPPVTTDSLLHVAETRFRQTLAQAAIDSAAGGSIGSIDYEEYRAYVGLARALLDEGNFADANTAAKNVPDTYTDSIERSANSANEQNGVYWYTTQDVRYAATALKGGAGLNYVNDGANGDPRIPVLENGAVATTFGDDGTIDTLQLLYPQYQSSGHLATGVEARLIQAEAALSHGDYGGATSYLTTARQNAALLAHGNASLLPTLVVNTDTTAIDTLFAERAYDLWLTGHRMYDMRRLVRAKQPLTPPGGGYGRDYASVWPTGSYWKTGPSYGTQVAFLIPTEESNNPYYTDGGCGQGLTP